MNRDKYLSLLNGHHVGDPPVTNTDVPVIQHSAAPCWRLVGCFRLDPVENGGNHNVYVDFLDDQGNVRVPPIAEFLSHSWVGMRPDETPAPTPFDKQPPDPACNIPLWPGQYVSCWILGALPSSDLVSNLHTNLPTEGDGGNRPGHHSFYLVFQQMRDAGPVRPPITPPILPADDEPYLFGLHEPGGEHLMLDAKRPGWLVFTEALGSDPNDPNGKDFTPWARGGIQALVRINYGYAPVGTIPGQEHYADFAQRCKRYVQASQGANRWIIGNEPNLVIERPYGEAITPALYAECFALCRQAIKEARGDAQVLVAGPGPWNNQTPYVGNEDGDWVRYLQDVLSLVECDGVALHTYTHGSDPSLITSMVKMDPPFQNYYYHFRAYQDFMAVIPPTLPVYITETNQNAPWLDQNTNWVQAAYAEIDTWNKTDPHQIRCLALYRWPPYDRMFIEGKQGVIADFQLAMQHEYRPAQRFPRAQVMAPANLRVTPGHLNKPPEDVLTVLQPKTTCPIIGGPQRVDGLAWWNLLSDNLSGWTAQIDPYGVVLLVLAPQSGKTADLDVLAKRYGIPVETAQAVLQVESGGQGFSPDGRMVIRFENHVFDIYYADHEQFAAHYRYGSPPWTGHLWRPGKGVWNPVHTGKQESEWDAFEFACTLQESNAMYSISMGAPQIMGFNHKSCGYTTVQGMYNAFSTSVHSQVEGFFKYLQNSGALVALQNQDYLRFATLYNGSGQAEYYAGLIKEKLQQLQEG